MGSAMNPSKIDISNITFSAPKTLDNGGKMLFLNYGGGIAPLYVQTPEVEIPFDPSYFSDNENSGKYSVKFSMKGLDENKSMKDFHTWACNMDELLLKKAAENSQSWFKKPKLSHDTLKELYTPMVKVSLDQETGEPNGKWPDSFGFKIIKRDGKFKDFSIYDKNAVVFDVEGTTENPTDISRLITKGAHIKSVLKCNGIWIANGKFGCTWRAEQIRVKVPEGGLRDFAIMSDSDDEDDRVETVTTGKTLVEDSTESDDNEDEPEPVKEKPKKVRKRRVVKKKTKA